MTAVVQYTPHLGWPVYGDGASTSANTFVFQNNTAKIFWSIQIEEACTITHLYFSFSTVTAPPVLRANIQGLATTGLADGTPKGGGSPASGTFTPAATAAGVWAELTNPYSAAAGEFVAIGADYSSGTVGASNNATFRTASSSLNAVSTFPFAAQATTGSFTRLTQAPSFFGYKSATKAYGHPATFTAITASTTAEIGTRFSLQGPLGSTYSVVGAKWKGAIPSGSHFWWLTLYDDVTVLQQIALDTDAMGNAAGQVSWHTLYFDEATLSKLKFGRDYHLGLCCSTSRTSASYLATFPAASDRSAFSQSTDCAYISRTLGSAVTTGVGPVSGETAWTVDTSSLLQIYPIVSDWNQTFVLNSRATAHLRR